MIIPNEHDFILHYQLKHPTIFNVPTFRYYDLPIMGVGPKGHSFIEMDRFIDTSGFPGIYRELKENIELLGPMTKGLVVNGIVPKEHNRGFSNIDSILLNPGKYLNFDYSPDIKDLITLSRIKSHFYKHFNLPEPWQGVCHMRNYTTYAYKNHPSSWMEHSEPFPLLRKFIESLPFKSLGYALFFISHGNNRDAAFIHRDIFHKSHSKSNFINILFDQKPRPFFVYDAIKKEKVYLNPKCCMYYFNESDLHGVDAEPEPRYMLRVEGIFTDEFASSLGLIKHQDYFEAFDWNYEKPQDYLATNGPLNIWQETDL